MKRGRPYKSLYLPALIIVATVLTLLIVIAISTYRNISRDLERAEDSLLHEGLVIVRAVEAGARTNLAASGPDLSLLEKIVQEVSREPSLIGILLFDSGGKILVSAPKGGIAETVGDVSSLDLLVRERGVVTRYYQTAAGEKAFEVIKPFRPFAYKNPLALLREGEEKVEPQEEPLQRWAKDKWIAVRLRLGAFDRAREQDLHHAILMGAILVILGGELFILFSSCKIITWWTGRWHV